MCIPLLCVTLGTRNVEEVLRHVRAKRTEKLLLLFTRDSLKNIPAVGMKCLARKMCKAAVLRLILDFFVCHHSVTVLSY